MKRRSFFGLLAAAAVSPMASVKALAARVPHRRWYNWSANFQSCPREISELVRTTLDQLPRDTYSKVVRSLQEYPFILDAQSSREILELAGRKGVATVNDPS